MKRVISEQDRQLLTEGKEGRENRVVDTKNLGTIQLRLRAQGPMLDNQRQIFFS